MPVQNLAGKVAVVTGAGNGIGRAIARCFAEAGAAVACLDLDAGPAKSAAEEIGRSGGKSLAVICDVSRELDTVAAAKSVQDAFGGVHVLVNAAAVIDPNGSVLELAPDDWDRVFAVNVRGAYLMSRAVLPMMIAAGGGSIIHIASQMGHVARPRQATYSATKSALLLLAKGMALDHAGEGIRVNTLSPGGIATQGMAERWGDMATAEREWGKRMHPLGRLGRVEEIAAAAVFLASEESSFVTGTDLLVDGGYTAL